MSDHGGFQVGDRVLWANPYGIDRREGDVVRLARNGYLTIRELEFLTTVDVDPAGCELLERG